MLKPKKSLTKFALTQIKAIHEKSRQLNSSGKAEHGEVLLRLMREHSQEISELFQARDPHFVIETGDLAVLCLELMLDSREAPDVILEKCYQRYHKKIGFLLKNKAGRKSRDKHKQEK